MKQEYEFSAGLRFTHWMRALMITILIVSGYYLAYVFLSPSVSDRPTLFLQAKWRFVHIVAGFVLIGVTIFKSYLFFFDFHSKKELVSFKDIFNIKIWIAQIKFYLFLGDQPHIRGVYNPLHLVAYVTFYICLFFVCLTGVMLYSHVYHEGLGAIFAMFDRLEPIFGGLSEVRTIHHLCMNYILIFVPIHVYMVIFNSIKGRNGSVDSIVNGYKFK